MRSARRSFASPGPIHSPRSPGSTALRCARTSRPMIASREPTPSARSPPSTPKSRPATRRSIPRQRWRGRRREPLRRGKSRWPRRCWRVGHRSIPTPPVSRLLDWAIHPDSDPSPSRRSSPRPTRNWPTAGSINIRTSRSTSIPSIPSPATFAIRACSGTSSRK